MKQFLRIALLTGALTLLGAGCARQQTPEVAVEVEGSAQGEITVGAPVQEELASVAPPEAVIEYREGVFEPSTIRVLVGTKVTFVNKGTKPVWPASGLHPTHQICPGFDSLKGIGPGETYSYTFERVAECPFHNHLSAGERGSIEVKEAD